MKLNVKEKKKAGERKLVVMSEKSAVTPGNQPTALQAKKITICFSPMRRPPLPSVLPPLHSAHSDADGSVFLRRIQTTLDGFVHNIYCILIGIFTVKTPCMP
jgi:hypothetical protein